MCLIVQVAVNVRDENYSLQGYHTWGQWITRTLISSYLDKVRPYKQIAGIIRAFYQIKTKNMVATKISFEFSV